MNAKSEDVARTIGADGSGRGLGPVLAAGAVALALALGALYWFGARQAASEVLYATEPVTRGSFEVVVSASGTVEPTNLVEVSSEISGTLDEVLVDYNDTVEEGTVLARLDTTRLEAELAVARASLDASIARVARARATLEEARDQFERMQDLDARGVVSEQEVTTSRAALRRAQADLQTAEADQKLAEATLDLRQSELDKACICSPIRGVVLDRAVDPGQIVAATLQAPILFTLAEDLAQMELRVDVDEADVGRIAVGQPATFVVDAYDDRTFPAAIAEIRFAPETIDGVVTYKAILTIDNSDRLLMPGMTATADIVVDRVADGLIVPNAALRYRPAEEADAGDEAERSGLLGMLIPDMQQETDMAGSERTLWVPGDGGPREIEVEVGNTNGRLTEIVAGDVVEGQPVIVGELNE